MAIVELVPYDYLGATLFLHDSDASKLDVDGSVSAGSLFVCRSSDVTPITSPISGVGVGKLFLLSYAML